MINTFLRYGIPNELARRLESIGLPKTTIERTSNRNLIQKYGLTSEEVGLIKDHLRREPIDERIIQELLEKSNYTCCACKGVKSDSYIIHHIEHYSVSQDNSYANLAVLCLNDHEIAHKEGTSLTLKLTPDQIRNAKLKWEIEVTDRRIYMASISADIHELEFINIPRVIELSKEILKEIPKTDHTESLKNQGLITRDGYLNEMKLAKLANDPNSPLIFFAPYGSTQLCFHYLEIFKQLLTRIEFEDLDALLSNKELKNGIIGKYCYYVGGLYTKHLSNGHSQQLVKLHFSRRKVRAEWLADLKYYTSSSAQCRAFQRNTYLIYGKVMNVSIETNDGKKEILVDLRPYCFGLPKEAKNRTPNIAYQREIQEMLQEEEE